MPELPEVETTRRGIDPHIHNQTIAFIKVRQPRLRWDVPTQVQDAVGLPVTEVSRRGKYLLLHTDAGAVLIHLGMSGSLRYLTVALPPAKHDHVDIGFASGGVLRLTDPRRFGAVLWQAQGGVHPLLQTLGPEPLSDAFNVEHLVKACHNRRVAIKALIMDSHVVVGVGNIYANEALFRAGIDPRRAAGRIAASRLETLVSDIKTVLAAAIEQGGTTLKDFVDSDGKPGYFKQALAVYGRAGEPCVQCLTPLKEVRLGQRSTVFCSLCQR